MKLLPLFDLEILVKVFEKASIFTYNFHTMYAIAFKLHTPVQCHELTLYNKLHNSELIYFVYYNCDLSLFLRQIYIVELGCPPTTLVFL